MAEVCLIKENIQFGLVIAVLVNLLVIKGNGFYYLVRAVELLGQIAEAGVTAKRRQLIYPFG